MSFASPHIHAHAHLSRYPCMSHLVSVLSDMSTSIIQSAIQTAVVVLLYLGASGFVLRFGKG